MGDEAFMKAQIEEKLEQGFNCIKLKIGAIDFQKNSIYCTIFVKILMLIQ